MLGGQCNIGETILRCWGIWTTRTLSSWWRPSWCLSLCATCLTNVVLRCSLFRHMNYWEPIHTYMFINNLDGWYERCQWGIPTDSTVEMNAFRDHRYFIKVLFDCSLAHIIHPELLFLLGSPPILHKSERAASLLGCDGEVVFTP